MCTIEYSFCEPVAVATGSCKMEVYFMRISLQEAAAKLMAAEKVVVTAHVNPDGDALGSSLAL